MEGVILIHTKDYEVTVLWNSQLHLSVGGYLVLITTGFYIVRK